VINHVTLDGVMQGPGRRDEDTRGGFAHGGWALPRGDDAIVAKAGERMGGDRAFLFGRRTYEQLLASWNAQGGPFKDALNNTQKYVASHSPATRLEWPNSTLLDGDVPAAVAELKQASSGNLVITGSGAIIDEATHDRLVGLLKDPSQRPLNYGRPRVHPLARVCLRSIVLAEPTDARPVVTGCQRRGLALVRRKDAPYVARRVAIQSWFQGGCVRTDKSNAACQPVAHRRRLYHCA
jgi:dihydrofolate reductase